jgi:hypothetical protein
MKIDQTECSEMLAHKIQAPGNHPKERIQHSEHGKSLNSRNINLFAIEHMINSYGNLLILTTVICNILQIPACEFPL